MTPPAQPSLSAAQAALGRGDLPSAEKIVAALLGERPDDVETLWLLAHMRRQQGPVQAWAETVERLTTLAPAQVDAPTYQTLAKLRDSTGDRETARAVLARAVAAHPRDIDLHLAHANLAGERKQVCGALEEVLATFADDPAAVSQILNVLTLSRAKLRRAEQGLPEDHVVSWEDTCTWPDPEGLLRFRSVIKNLMKTSQQAYLVLDAASIAICEKKWERADRFLDLVRTHGSGTYADFAAFGPTFHAELDAFDHERMAGLLPPVHHIASPPYQADETLFFASDPSYFREFTRPVIDTLERLAIPLDIHAHVMGGDPAAWREMAAGLDKFTHVRVAFSAEDPGPGARTPADMRVYSHAIRYVRLFLEAARKRRRMWLFDVDVFVQRDPRPLLARLADNDVAIRATACLLAPPARVAGNLVGVAPTPRGLEFARRTAAYIMYWRQRGTWGWGIDQIALHSAYAYMDHAGQAPRTYFQTVADASNHEGDSVFYFPTGIKKHMIKAGPGSVKTTDASSLSAARAAFDAGDLSGAERVVRALLVVQSDDVDALDLLANVQDRRKDVHACAATLERLVVLAPARIEAAKYRLLAKLHIHGGDPEKARSVLAQGIRVYPENLDLHVMHANLAGGLAEMCDALEGVLARFSQDAVAVSAILNAIAVSRGKLSRAARALPEDGLSWEDTSTWPDPDGLERFRRVIAEQMKATQRGELVLDAACIAVWDRKWDRADRLLEAVRTHRAGTFADYTAFGSKFHEGLDRYSDEAISSLLPPVHHILAPPHQAAETLLLASDPKYFRQFTRPFLDAMEQMEIPVDIQVHVMGGDEASWRDIAAGLDRFRHVRVAFSAEDPGPFAVGLTNVRLYCHAIRFVRLFQTVAHTRRPTWVFDVDAFVQKDPRPLLGRLAACDVSIRTNPCLLTPPARVAGNLVGISPTERGLAYARRVAAYILHWKEAGSWAFGIDQVALDSAYVHMDRTGTAPKTYFQGQADASNGAGDSVFYFPTGANKYIAATKPAS